MRAVLVLVASVVVVDVDVEGAVAVGCRASAFRNVAILDDSEAASGRKRPHRFNQTRSNSAE